MISKSDKKQIFRLYGELLRSNHDKPGTQIESWVVWKTQLTQKLKVDNKERDGRCQVLGDTGYLYEVLMGCRLIQPFRTANC